MSSPQSPVATTSRPPLQSASSTMSSSSSTITSSHPQHHNKRPRTEALPPQSAVPKSTSLLQPVPVTSQQTAPPVLKKARHPATSTTAATKGDTSNMKPPKKLPVHEGPPVPTPVTLLKLIFAATPKGQVILKQQAASTAVTTTKGMPGSRPSKFTKPSPEAIEAYNLRVVKAIRESNVPMLRTMVQEERLSLNACNRFGESIIHMACRRGDVNVVRFLLQEAHVKVSVCDDYGRTPLHDACWTAEPNFAVMDVLLQHAPTEMLITEDVRGHTPFHYARKEHWESWVSYLKERETKLRTLLNVQQVVG